MRAGRRGLLAVRNPGLWRSCSRQLRSSLGAGGAVRAAGGREPRVSWRRQDGLSCKGGLKRQAPREDMTPEPKQNRNCFFTR